MQRQFMSDNQLLSRRRLISVCGFFSIICSRSFTRLTICSSPIARTIKFRARFSRTNESISFKDVGCFLPGIGATVVVRVKLFYASSIRSLYHKVGSIGCHS